jgi:hypothetical protein
MHTQNVNTAAQERSERWGKNQPDDIVTQQRALFTQLAGVRNLQLTLEAEAQEVCRLLRALADNAFSIAVMEDSRIHPLTAKQVIQYWLDAKKLAVHLYAGTGAGAWECVRNKLEEDITFARELLQLNPAEDA